MVKIYTVILCLCFGSLAYGQIYVNASATGANNGTSWANAFTKVESALAATGTNIWIAKGTYKPEGPANDTSVFFKMTTPKNIYGGFAGTETTLAARNIAANATVLNGDMLGNDNVDSLYFNKSDNRRHVLFIDSLVRGKIILDGLTVSGGATKDVTGGTNRRETSGGGVLSYTSLTIRNCTFLNNYGRTGGGVCVYGDSLYTSDVLVENTTFEKNLGMATGHNGAGIYAILIDSVVLNNVTAIKNNAVQGAVACWTGNYLGINNCLISENVNNVGGLGAGLFSINVRHQNIQNSTFSKNTSNIAAGSLGAFIQNTAFQQDPNNSTTINNCFFRENVSATGSVAALQISQGNKMTITNSEFIANKSATNSNIYLNSSASIFGKADNLNVSNCKFFNNVVESAAVVVGAALYMDSSTGSIKDCEFADNIGVRGPHISFRGTAPTPVNDAFRPNVVTVENCTFNGGASTSIGGATYSQLSNGKVIFKKCTFTANKGGANGGAIWHGFTSKTEVDDCDFLLNESATFGGAIYIQNDLTDMVVKNSRFTSNNALGSGGAFGMFSHGSGVSFINNDFIANTCDGSGAALYILSAANIELPTAFTIVDRNLFEANIAKSQGAGLYLLRRGGTVQNNIFYNNEAPNDGVGGAIAYNHVDTLLKRELFLVNNTFLENKNDVVSGISFWKDPTALKPARGLVNLQNNIFIENVGAGYEPNDTTINVEVISKGGNIYTNAASMAFMNASLDQVSGSFKLNDDFSPIAGSSAINYGIGNGAPLYDYNNLLRVGRPDAGAVEFGATVSGVKASDIKSLTIYPNPSADYIKVDELAVSNARYLIFSLDGKLVEKGSIPANGQIDIKKLTVGNYYLQVNDGKLSIGSFVKQ